MLKARHKLGKYRIENRISEGGFASVYQAYDTIEGVRVALKIPTASTVNPQMLKDFRNEVRLASKLVHPNILPIKDASIIDGTFVIVLPLITMACFWFYPVIAAIKNLAFANYAADQLRRHFRLVVTERFVQVNRSELVTEPSVRSRAGQLPPVLPR